MFWVVISLIIIIFIFILYYQYRVHKYPIVKGTRFMVLFTIPDWLFALPVVRVLNKISKLFFNDKSPNPNVSRKIITIPGFKNAEIQISIFEPIQTESTDQLPCLMYFHGGGFFMYEVGYHYHYACEYALHANCKVFFVHYRLATEFPFPTSVEDCYSALIWVNDHATSLNIDQSRIAVGGDSAGGTISAVLSLMSRDRNGPKICFQMLIYPALGTSETTESMKKFTDSPLFNSRAAKKILDLYLREGDFGQLRYAKPGLEKDLTSVPSTYIEIEEFDCLRDDGEEYARMLQENGIETQVFFVKGGFHGADIFINTEHSKQQTKIRVQALQKAFKK